MDDPRLPDGTPVGIRPLVPADRRWLAAAVERLSPESRYSRFLTPLRTLDRAMLDQLTETVDDVDHVAVLATLDPGGASEARAAVGRYVRRPDLPGAAELAITVTDVVQGRGVGTVVARHLVDRAKAAGIDTFTAVVATDNRASMTLLGHLGETSRELLGSGAMELRVRLA